MDPTGKRLVRRRIMLTEAQDKMLEALAKRHGITVSALHRRLIDLVLQGFVAVADLDEDDES